MKTSVLLLWACRLLIGGIFLISSVPKTVVPGRLFGQVMEYHLVGPGLAAVVAVSLPWLELLLGLALLSGALAGGAFFTSTVLLFLFTAVQIWALRQGLAVGCGCFTLAEDAGPISGWTVARTTTLALLSLAGLWVLHDRSRGLVANTRRSFRPCRCHSSGSDGVLRQ